MTRTRLLVLSLALSLTACGLRGQEPAPLSDAQFAKVHALIKRTKDEWAWTEVAWKIRFSDAQKIAASEGKPILVAQAAQGSITGCS